VEHVAVVSNKWSEKKRKRRTLVRNCIQGEKNGILVTSLRRAMKRNEPSQWTWELEEYKRNKEGKGKFSSVKHKVGVNRLH